jgi:hypothetical protein
MSLNLSDEKIHGLNAYARDKFAAEQYPFAPRCGRSGSARQARPEAAARTLPTRKPFVPSWLLQKKNKRRR